MNFLFLGQDNFGNRGCEALIRSTVKLLTEQDPHATFTVPSGDIPRDSAQWPEAKAAGVTFCPAEPFPSTIRWWGRAQRRLPLFKRFAPRFNPTARTQALIKQADVVIMTGGDIVSLDYGLESLYYWIGLCRFAAALGKPVVLSAASVGPFTKEPEVERNMREILKEFSLITVRESASQTYLAQLGVPVAALVGDPAFCLDASPPRAGLGPIQLTGQCLGVNVSPLIERFKGADQAPDHIVREICAFVQQVIGNTEMNVALLSHVDPLDGSGGYNSDYAYQSNIHAQLLQAGVPADRITLLPQGLNCQELKHVLSQLTYFIGARTHATVGALSKGVPTISIAYSVKASGINKMIFDSDDYVLPTPKLSCATLTQYLQKLQQSDMQVRAHLKARMPTIQQQARRNAAMICSLQRA